MYEVRIDEVRFDEAHIEHVVDDDALVRGDLTGSVHPGTGSGITLRPLRTSGALRAGCTVGAISASGTGVALGSLRTSSTIGSVVTVRAGGTLRSGSAISARGSCITLGALRSSGTFRPDQP